MSGTCGLEFAPPASKLPRLKMEEPDTPSADSVSTTTATTTTTTTTTNNNNNNNGSGDGLETKPESRKRMLGRYSGVNGRIVGISRQASFDIATSPNSLSLDDSGSKLSAHPHPRHQNQRSQHPHPHPHHQQQQQQHNHHPSAFSGVALQRSNSTFAGSASNGSTSPPPCSQEVRQRLKDHLLSRRGLDPSHTASHSFLPTSTATDHPVLHPSLPRKRVAYDQQPEASGEDQSTASKPAPSLIRESKPGGGVPFQRATSCIGMGCSPRTTALGPLLMRQMSYDPPVAHNCNAEGASRPSDVDMPLDLTAAKASTSVESVLRLRREGFLQRQASTGTIVAAPWVVNAAAAPVTTVKDIAMFLQQQVEAERNASMLKHLSAFSPPVPRSLAPAAAVTVSAAQQTTTTVPGLQATAASLISFCRSQSVMASQQYNHHQQQQLSNNAINMAPISTAAMFQRQHSAQVRHNLQETQENLAALTLSGSVGPSSQEKTTSSPPPPPPPPPPSSQQSTAPTKVTSEEPMGPYDFLRSALEGAYDELLRLWTNLPCTETWPTSAADAKPAPETNEDLLAASLKPPKLLARTGLLFDPTMLSHVCLCPHGNTPQVHPEYPLRVISIIERITTARLQMPCGVFPKASTSSSSETKDPAEAGAHFALPESLPLAFFCHWMRARMATKDELALFHTRDYIDKYCPDPDDNTATVTGQTSPNPTSPSACPPPNGIKTEPETPNESIPMEVDTSPPQTVDRRRSREGKAQTKGAKTAPEVATLACGGLGVDSDTIWNPHTTSKAARLAVGQVLCLAHNLASGRLRNGFALVHPPGHHAEPGHAMGYCYFNSVAVAALSLLKSGQASRVLILDWDIHHGNGTQYATSASGGGLLYVSLHRYDQGTFFPGTGGNGTGKNHMCVNIPWGSDDRVGNTGSADLVSMRREAWQKAVAEAAASNPIPLATPTAAAAAASLRRESWRTSIRHSSPVSMSNDSGVLSTSTTTGDASPASASIDNPIAFSPSSVVLSDAEYLAAFRTVVMPMATEFAPDVVLVSAGFDAALGHGNALGGYEMSPGAFAWMTRQCMSLANGRVGLVLEGGYVASVTAECVSTCLNALLLPNPPPSSARLASLEDALNAAAAWVAPSELTRPPRPEAVKTLLEVASTHASTGRWHCLKEVVDASAAAAAEFALPFKTAIEQERARLMAQGPLGGNKIGS